MDIHYSDGSAIHAAVIVVWADYHTERSGFYRAFWAASPTAMHGSPIVGYCSSGGSYRTIREVVNEAHRLYPNIPVYRNRRLQP